ncbi:hypothetical protein NS263_06635 [Curtobacterium oceanosedimentum]|uniref:Uncharacterized protein n=1 Tax=Curtobacterium oceanosedimentum TaxID=465820 RepID=A0ABR5S748_9MICO|nr:hypothetical protein NS263_06635 [Curtobacterium oceanosedimentum]
MIRAITDIHEQTEHLARRRSGRRRAASLLDVCRDAPCRLLESPGDDLWCAGSTSSRLAAATGRC